MQATLQKNASVAVARANKGVPCGPAAMPRLPAQVARVAGAPQTIRYNADESARASDMLLQVPRVLSMD
jgi:hypothetical protein